MDMCMHVRMNATHLEDPLIKSGEHAAWRLAICLESGNNVGWDRDEEITGANPDTWLEHYGALSRRLDSHDMPRTPGFTRGSIREHHIGSDRGKLQRHARRPEMGRTDVYLVPQLGALSGN